MRQPTYPARQLSLLLRKDHEVSLEKEANVDDIFKLLQTFANLVDTKDWEKRSDRPSFNDVFAVRFQLQHYILRLPISITRTALLLLSDIYIVPMAPYVKYQERISRLLQSQLIEDGRDLNANLHVWCLAVGGIGASGSTRTWFAQQMAELSQKQDLKDMASVRRVLSTVHWCDAAFATPLSEAFWTESANILGVTPFFDRNTKSNSRRPSALMDTYNMVQTIAVEYVM